MKVNSLETESMDGRGRVIATSKTIFKAKPSVGVRESVFEVIKGNITEHLKFSTGDVMITVRTSQGVFRRFVPRKKS